MFLPLKVCLRDPAGLKCDRRESGGSDRMFWGMNKSVLFYVFELYHYCIQAMVYKKWMSWCYLLLYDWRLCHLAVLHSPVLKTFEAFHEYQPFPENKPDLHESATLREVSGLTCTVVSYNLSVREGNAAGR